MFEESLAVQLERMVTMAKSTKKGGKLPRTGKGGMFMAVDDTPTTPVEEPAVPGAPVSLE